MTSVAACPVANGGMVSRCQVFVVTATPPPQPRHGGEKLDHVVGVQAISSCTFSEITHTISSLPDPCPPKSVVDVAAPMSIQVADDLELQFFPAPPPSNTVASALHTAANAPPAAASAAAATPSALTAAVAVSASDLQPEGQQAHDELEEAALSTPTGALSTRMSLHEQLDGQLDAEDMSWILEMT